MDAGSCDELEVPLREATPPADADATWALVQAWAPTAVEWSRALHDEDSDPVVLSVEAAAEPLVVTRSGSAPYCPPGPDLRFPVRVELAIGGAGGDSDETDAVILVEGAIDTSDGVALNLTCFESECVTLGPTWDALGQDRMEASLNEGQAFVTYGVFLSGSVDQTGIQIAGYGDYVPVDDNYGILVSLWAGALR